MTYALVIFDLDGTLVDSFPWFRRNLNGVADRFAFRRVAEDEIESLRHADTREILARLEVASWKLPAIARHMRQLKSRGVDDIPLFDGVAEMLRTLFLAGVHLALVSSDTEANARRQLGDLAALFRHFDCGAAVFGKAGKFRRVMRRAGLKPADVIAIGDEIRDIEAARAAGIACGAVRWGYASMEALRALGPDLAFDRVEEIAQALVDPLASTTR